MKKGILHIPKSTVHQALQVIFRDRKFLQIMKSDLGLLPLLFERNKLINFLKHPKARDYITEAEVHKKPKSQTYTQKVNQLYSILGKARPEVEAYINFIFNEYPRDIVFSRQLIDMCDMRQPQNWYIEARSLQRKVIYHHGPTNSGKTSAAIQALKRAKSGVYMAPLRMLAWQTQQRLLPCTLITGQEKQIMISGLTSCTIETLDMGAEYDVAVIDEIQLISDFTRGWAWTQALLGVKAKELHLCGENRALGLIHKIVKYTVDNLEERRYTRFSKLHLIHKPFNIETDLLPGDCLIVFSTMSVYKMRTQINKIYSGRNENKVAVVYGKLPPECRKVQANLFNDGTLPYLVATNAIGMGLNLKIRRVIFMELQKRDDDGKIKVIQPNEIQQIAGRAGRGSTDGYVQAVNSSDLKVIRKALKRIQVAYGVPLSQDQNENSILQYKQEEQVELPIPENYSQHLKRQLTADELDIQTAAVYCSFFSLERFTVAIEALRRQKMNMSEIFKTFMDSSQREDWCFIQDYKEFCELAQVVEQYGLTTRDHYNFAKAPLNLGREPIRNLKNFARDYINQKVVRVPESILEDYKNHFTEDFKNESSVARLQSIYQHIEVYIWLASKFELAFQQLDLAIQIKACISQRINTLLNRYNSKTKVITNSEQ